MKDSAGADREEYKNNTVEEHLRTLTALRVLENVKKSRGTVKQHLSECVCTVGTGCAFDCLVCLYDSWLSGNWQAVCDLSLKGSSDCTAPLAGHAVNYSATPSR